MTKPALYGAVGRSFGCRVCRAGDQNGPNEAHAGLRAGSDRHRRARSNDQRLIISTRLSLPHRGVDTPKIARRPDAATGIISRPMRGLPRAERGWLRS
jgi:hypothetical protein